MDTGKKIKLIRTFRGLTQKELGEACGIHEVAIRKYELGKNLPKPEQLRKIAEALNVNVNSLIEFDIEADGDVKTGINIVRRAVEEPVRQIANNAGLEGSVVVAEVKNSAVGVGFDAYKGEYVDMIANGIVDPAKVTRSALQNAASIAAMVLTTETLVADKPAPEGAANPMAGAGAMGGMPGMM